MAEEKKRPSVADILAAARKNKPAEESGAPAASAETAEKPAPAAAKPPPAVSKPAPAAAKPAGGAKPSVAEMLAMARAQKAGGDAPAAAAPVEKPAPVAKPAAKPVEKAVDKAAAKPAPAKVVAKDTASILASARGGAKPGPVTKAEAAATDAKEDKEATAAAKAKLAAVPPMPAKPEYAKPKPKGKDAAADISRRGMIGWIAGAAAFVTGSAFAMGNTAMAMTGGLWTLGMARFMFPNILTEPPSRFKVGFKDAFAPGMVDTRFVSQFGVWVVNTEFQGQRMIYALRTVCTHLGCTPNWLEGEQKFKCPCHGSGFYKDGINFEGPAPRPLERYAIRIADDGQLEIDKSRMFQEELGQWADPSSFIPV